MSEKNNFYPTWYEKIAPISSYRSIFKWGAPDVFKHPNKNLYKLMKARLAMTDADFRKKRVISNSNIKFTGSSRFSSPRDLLPELNITTPNWKNSSRII